MKFLATVDLWQYNTTYSKKEKNRRTETVYEESDQRQCKISMGKALT